MRVLPVLDVQDGVVVRGVGGRRAEYRPIVSRLTASCQPVDVAEAFRTHFGFAELYVADLDAIAGRPPALPLYRDLLGRGFRLWVDAGLGPDTTHPRDLASIGVQTLVVGLESLDGPGQLESILKAHSPAALVFSLDLKEGRPLGRPENWINRDARSIAEQAVGLGIGRILVLDLAGVGSNEGTPTGGLCVRLRLAYPDLEITTGGGVRGMGDVRDLKHQGLDYVLLASALHDGRLTPAEIKSLDD